MNGGEEEKDDHERLIKGNDFHNLIFTFLTIKYSLFQWVRFCFYISTVIEYDDGKRNKVIRRIIR